MLAKWVYLALFAAGVIIPMSVLVPWVGVHGVDLRLFTQQLFANRVSTFFALDLLLTALCVLFFAVQASPRLRLWWVPVVFTCLIGVSVGLPLLLYLRADDAEKR